MSSTLRDRTLALAGIAQAAALVKQVARTGAADEAAFATCLYSIFQTQPDATAEVYAGVDRLAPGLRLLAKQLGTENQARDIEIAKYMIGVMTLERQLAKRPQMLVEIAAGIERIRRQAEHYSFTHPIVVSAIAALYAETISVLTPRIIVQGEQGYLSKKEVAEQVRALLLAAIRSTVLWRQCGGSRLQILLSRGKIHQMIEQLLRGQ
ncbi:MAG: hypothetical protein FD165_1134 [Gammaproteobacteria bacterium]|nr:MAG: hypothetical protein FD165_1134 [Gammaproteobacteria bacterium]TND07293.1 MAG: hypothetical protein FD120_31 [Gammaproteobacteria bacterium]